MARRGEIGPVIGRADEIEQAVEILSRRTKNNPVLVGEPSVEDTVAVLRGLRDDYEAHHQVRITDAALDAAADRAGEGPAQRALSVVMFSTEPPPRCGYSFVHST